MLKKESAQHVIYEIMKLYPDAIPTMRYQNPFQLLMVVILSAQATDESVAKVKDQLFERYPDPQAVIESSPEEIETYIKTVGLYRNKAKYIYKSSGQLLEKFDGKVPNTRKELESLTGIGPKSANILLNVAFNQDAFAVDTHVTRICKHHKIVDENATPKQIEERITEIIPAKYWGRAHQAMISFGKEICTPRNMKCHDYPQLYENIEEVDSTDPMDAV
ncbi:endonuclease III [Carnobacterium sp. ISL-102]|uniref:endonuclease III n=1 Tax=Carnobacterium sp. ISL-102 TaxID=2819142 RepID=UPI001BE86145|nr:endonuclease III [Carnobacterium sp. ISL-102]MBT2732248.1 endonuclease III [Carnobacterium sp. ISL-102]